MRTFLCFSGLLFLTALISTLYAEGDIPSILLEQKRDMTSIPATTKLVEWRLKSAEEVKSIATSFIKNSKDHLSVSIDSLKPSEAFITPSQKYDCLLYTSDAADE